MRKRLMRTAVLGFGAALAIGGFAAPAGAGATPDEVFDDEGTHQFTVPDGVFCYDVVALGAAGGRTTLSASPVPGGAGSRVDATIAVNPGDEIEVNVGGMGEDGRGSSGDGEGGFNGGGDGDVDPDGGSFGQRGGGGGGRSDVSVNGGAPGATPTPPAAPRTAPTPP